jgi:hypothetical protein
MHAVHQGQPNVGRGVRVAPENGCKCWRSAAYPTVVTAAKEGAKSITTAAHAYSCILQLTREAWAHDAHSIAYQTILWESMFAWTSAFLHTAFLLPLLFFSATAC